MAGMLLDGSVVFGEAKWSVKHVGVNQVSEPQSRIARVNYLKESARKYLLLFSRSGFNPQLIQLAESDPLVRTVSFATDVVNNPTNGVRAIDGRGAFRELHIVGEELPGSVNYPRPTARVAAHCTPRW
jgi:hypothetical protein